jgi:hypothetical protein
MIYSEIYTPARVGEMSNQSIFQKLIDEIKMNQRMVIFYLYCLTYF